ncbi:hypothetical protein T492DRAFT_903658 [Pavlovales sp. CCMP2436]|nr:hypothetical protein T492DRAFT_903658 [Pavlovales sp. CCMP2436]
MVSPCKGWGLQKAQRSVSLHRRAYRSTLLRMLYTGLGFDKQNASDADEAEMIVAHRTGDAKDTGNYKVSVFHFDALAIYFMVKTVAFLKLGRQIWPFVEPKLVRARTQMALAGTAPAVAITYVLDGAPSRRPPDEREFRINKRAVEELAARSPTVQEAPRPTGAESIRTGKREETSRSRTEEILHAQLASGQEAGAQLDEAEARAHQSEFLRELEKAYSSGLKDNICPLASVNIDTTRSVPGRKAGCFACAAVAASPPTNSRSILLAAELQGVQEANTGATSRRYKSASAMRWQMAHERKLVICLSRGNDALEAILDQLPQHDLLQPPVDIEVEDAHGADGKAAPPWPEREMPKCATSACPPITRGAALLSPDEWTVSETDSTSRAVCPGHEHVVKRLEGLARENGDSTRSTTPLQLPGGLPSLLYLSLRGDPVETRRRYFHCHK